MFSIKSRISIYKFKYEFITIDCQRKKTAVNIKEYILCKIFTKALILSKTIVLLSRESIVTK